MDVIQTLINFVQTSQGAEECKTDWKRNREIYFFSPNIQHPAHRWSEEKTVLSYNCVLMLKCSNFSWSLYQLPLEGSLETQFQLPWM